MSYSTLAKIVPPLHAALILAFALSTATLGAQSTSANPPVINSPTAITTEPLPGETTPGPGNVTTPTVVMTPAQMGGRLGVMVEHDFESDLTDGASGNMNVTDYEVYGNYAHHFTDTDRLTVGADYLYRDFNFHGTGSPFGDVQQAGVNGWYAHDFDQQWGGFAYLYGGFAAEKAASFGDGGQLAGGFGPTVNVTNDLHFAIGPMVYSRPGDDAAVAIVGNLEWAFLPQWNLHLYAGISDGATVSYDIFNDHTTTLETSLEFNNFWFRAQDGPGGTERGVVETDVTFKVGVRRELGNNFFIRGFISGIFDREYQFHTGDHAAGSFKVDPTAGVGLELGWSF